MTSENDNSEPDETETTQNLEGALGGGSGEGQHFVRPSIVSGDVVGGYEVKEEIGMGGMAVVYRGFDPSLEREVALKVLPRNLADEESSRKRFIREARSAASLNHPNIVQVYSAGEEDGYVFMAMEFIRGRTLKAVIEEQGQFEYREALRIARDVAAALQAAHNNGIIHRDIKPSNIMLTGEGEVKVADFGLSRSVSANSRITRTGTYLGTPAYSSPEQCESHDLDERSDIYSLGAVLYEMMTGEIPHEADTPLSMMKKIVEREPRPIEKFNDSVPEDVTVFVRTMLSRDPDDRFQDAGEVISEIDRLLDSESASSRTDEVVSAGGEGPSEQERQVMNSGLKILGSIAIPAALILFGFLVVPLLLSPEKTDTSPDQTNRNGNRTARSTDGPAGQKERVQIAILDFHNGTGKESKSWMEIGIPDLLISQLSQVDSLRLYSRAEVKSALSEENRSEKPGISKDRGKTSTRLKKAEVRALVEMGADVAVKGRYYIQGDKIRIPVQVFKLNSGDQSFKKLTTIQKTGDTSDIFPVMDSLSGELAEVLQRSERRAIAAVSESTRNQEPQQNTRDQFAKDLQGKVFAELDVGVEKNQEKGSEKSDLAVGPDQNTSERRNQTREKEEPKKSETGQSEEREWNKNFRNSALEEEETDKVKKKMERELQEKLRSSLTGKDISKGEMMEIHRLVCKSRQARENNDYEKLREVREELIESLINKEKLREKVKLRVLKKLRRHGGGSGEEGEESIEPELREKSNHNSNNDE